MIDFREISTGNGFDCFLNEKRQKRLKIEVTRDPVMSYDLQKLLF